MIRFERSKIDDSKTLHVLDEVLGVVGMPVHEFIQLWRMEYYEKNLHVCLTIITMKLQIFKSTRAGACWILLKLELEPASLKIRRTGGDAS